ncbi:hypothetical protein CS369_07400 [Candidatus Symbiopectobacterium sp. 'North America']|uniref:hypothetical protein n=1 Tax=Candidatus Symbiopectobacterium sp. 'North America' TaxID=2794574 RepID=UPI0018C9D238|nr:hypothetical protein [Candidatus Symbiopectobacterium sp. 'North America']MBG6244640.1 hypothetical protein [Candidatus Symbiopectobacterium sp. 'North America']
MDALTYPYTLQDLLSLYEFEPLLEPLHREKHYNALIDWAEKEVLFGNDSETLLIIASFCLDAKLDYDEINGYLDRYLYENKIKRPSADASALVWLKIQMWHLLNTPNAKGIEESLYLFSQHFFNFGPRFFSKTAHYLNNLYYQLYDSGWGDYPSRAESMDEQAILQFVQARIRPLYCKLTHNEWLALLAR